MKRKKEHTMNRKEFVVKSTAGLIGLGVAGCAAPAVVKKTYRGRTIEYRTLGKTGLKVTAVGSGASRTDVPSVVKRVIDMGVNFLDTGRMYAGGKNEEMIGKVIKGIRHNIVIQSRFYRMLLKDAVKIEQSINDSLKALQTDYIDIMIKQNAATKDELFAPAVLEAITKAKEAGKIRFCGFSAHKNQAEMLRLAVENGFYDVAMISYNHAGHYWHQGGAAEKPFDTTGQYQEWDQAELEKEIERAASSGMGLIAMKTCSAGPYKEEGQSEATYTAALRWILKNKHISTTVPAMGNFREVDEDINAMG